MINVKNSIFLEDYTDKHKKIDKSSKNYGNVYGNNIEPNLHKATLSLVGHTSSHEVIEKYNAPNLLVHYLKLGDKLSFYEAKIMRRVYYGYNLKSKKIIEEYKDLPSESFKYNKVIVTGLVKIRYKLEKERIVDFKTIQDYFSRIDKTIKTLDKIEKEFNKTSKSKEQEKKLVNEIKSYIRFKKLDEKIDDRTTIPNTKKYIKEYIGFFEKDPSKLVKKRIDLLIKATKKYKEKDNDVLLKVINILSDSLTKDFPKLIKSYNYNARIIQRTLKFSGEMVRDGKWK